MFCVDLGIFEGSEPEFDHILGPDRPGSDEPLRGTTTRAQLFRQILGQDICDIRGFRGPLNSVYRSVLGLGRSRPYRPGPGNQGRAVPECFRSTFVWVWGFSKKLNPNIGSVLGLDQAGICGPGPGVPEPRFSTLHVVEPVHAVAHRVESVLFALEHPH